MEKFLNQIMDKDIKKALILILDALKPLQNGTEIQEAVMDVNGVANYLKVKTSWVYKKVQHKEIPCIHLGKYPRFRRIDIDAWIDAGCPINKPQFKRLVAV